MSGDRLVVDTNIVIYLLQGDKRITDHLMGKDIYISFITELELMSFPGLEEEDLKKINKFLNSVNIVDIDPLIKRIVIELRRTFKFKLPDSLVLATAGSLDLTILTADKQLLKAGTVVDVQLYDL